MSQLALWCASLICLSLLVNAADYKVDSKVTVGDQMIKGIKQKSDAGDVFYSFLGIPYAMPPVGKLRFQSPEKPEKPSGTLVADKMPEVCLQIPIMDALNGNTNIVGSEDCLYLNVYVKEGFKDAKNQPVMVYIHGGGYLSGGAEELAPDLLMSENIVLVIIQYRLNVFGFLSTEDDFLPGNMGLKDQQMALGWVNQNIAYFGGNPNLVTIFGESAGAASVEMQILSPGSKGLFNRAILQSGSSFCPWAMGDRNRELTEKVAENFNCDSALTEKYLKCIQQLDGKELITYIFTLYEMPLSPTWVGPRVDGKFLPDRPEILLSKGRFNKVNIISGIVKHEGILPALNTLFVPSFQQKMVSNFNYYAPYALYQYDQDNSAAITKEILDFYIEGKNFDLTSINELTEMFGDIFMNMCHDVSAYYYTKNEKILTYLYEFNYKGEFSVLDYMGTPFTKPYISHTDDLIYILGGGTFLPFKLKSEEDLKFSKTMVELWTNFAKYGNPNKSLKEEIGFKWELSSLPSFQRLSLDSNPAMVQYSRIDAANFWMNLKSKKVQDILPAKFKKTRGKDEL